MRQHLQILKYGTYLLACLLFASCHGPRKARLLVDKVKQEAGNETEQMNQSAAKMQQAFSDERIDSVLKNRFLQRLNKYSLEIDSINREIASIEYTLDDRQRFRKNYEDSIKPAIVHLEAHMKNKALRMKRYTMLTEALDISKQNLFGLAAFFGTGKYIIPPENYNQASALFLPAIDSLIVFSNKYADVPRTATLVVNGYADGQSVDSSSELYNTLVEYLQKKPVEKATLNWALSELRSNAISNILDSLLKQKQPEFVNIDNVNFFFYGYGQGESYPSKKITNYQLDDERRRIVLVFWSVIPD